MAMKTYVDIHIHPSMKPFGQAAPGYTNNPDASSKNSIWHDDPPTGSDMLLNRSLTVTRFSQSNFTELFRGNFMVAVVSLYPVEKGFFTSRTGTGNIADVLYNFTTGLGRRKVDFIQRNYDDFDELKREYEFLRQLDNFELSIYGKKVKYSIVSNYDEIANNLNSPENVISVVLSMEGANLFSNNNSLPPDETLFLKNIDTVKNWKNPPFFVSLCHHFYNYLGGHARSLEGVAGLLIDQRTGMNSDLTPLGMKTIRRLLDKNSGRRILIDIKHMSLKVRMAYYSMLEREYGNENIPVIVSHGAVNGYPHLDDTSHHRKNNGLFNGEDINFFDDEIIRIARSGGIFGLQIDKRRIAGKREQLKIKYLHLTGRSKLRRWNVLVWNQIRHIADLLDSSGLPAWDTVCLGTDYDGMVSPIEGYSTSSEIPRLYFNLQNLADDYLRDKNFILPSNRTTSTEILDKIFSENALRFLSKYK